VVTKIAADVFVDMATFLQRTFADRPRGFSVPRSNAYNMEREDKKVFYCSKRRGAATAEKSVFELLCESTVERAFLMHNSNFEYSSVFQSRIDFPV